jgi:hypothetical protein
MTLARMRLLSLAVDFSGSSGGSDLGPLAICDGGGMGEAVVMGSERHGATGATPVGRVGGSGPRLPRSGSMSVQLKM